MITVIKPGTLTTLQDLGRFGYQAWGMPVSGVVDFYAAKAANLLVGNSPKAAVLEMTDEGGTFHFSEETLIAVTGALAPMEVNGTPHPTWSSLHIPAGSILHIGTMSKGRRLYLACTGSFAVPTVMGSKSTYLAAGVGGFEGRPLQAGDMLFRGTTLPVKRHPVVLPHKWQMPLEKIWQLNVTLGSQEEMFSQKDKQTFFSKTYVLENEIPRTSCQLKGPLLKPPSQEMISEPTGLGAVEVSTNGKLMIVLPDHGTSRGFAKIAYVIHAHFYKLAQMKLGDKIRFSLIDVETAADLYRLQESSLRALKEALDNNYL